VHNIFGRMGQLNIWFLRMRKKERFFFWIKHLVLEKEKHIFFWIIQQLNNELLKTMWAIVCL